MNTKFSKNISMFLAFLMVLSSVVVGVPNLAFASSGNLLQNGDFEQWEGEVPVGWFGSKSNITKSNVSRVEGDAQSGNMSVRLSVTGTTHQRFTTQPISIKGGANYTLTYWVKGSGEIRNAFYRGGNYSSYSNYTIVNSDQWQKVEYNFQYDNDANDVEIIFSVRNTKEVSHIQVDDVVLVSDQLDNRVSDVVATPISGAIEKGTLVILSTETEGARIYYTIDGQEPTIESILYNAPIEINETTTIKAVSVKDGMENSFVKEFNYYIENLISIAEARQLALGDIVTVEGVVTFIDNNKNYYIQDETAAIDIFKGREDLGLAVGDKARVTGNLAVYNGLLEIVPVNNSDVIKLSSDNLLPEPKVVTIPELGSYQSQRIKLEKVTMGTINTGGNTEITDLQGNKVNIYQVPSLENIIAGDLVDIIAVSSIFNTPQLRVRVADDIVKTELGPDTQEPVIVHTPIAEANISLDLEVKAKVTDDRGVESVKLYYRTVGQTEYNVKNMVLANEEYIGLINKGELDILGLEYYIEASDGTNTVTNPRNIEEPYRVNIADKDITAPIFTIIEPVDGAVLDKTETKPGIKSEYSDPSGIDLETVQILLDGVDVTSGATIKENLVAYVPEVELALGRHTVTVKVKDKVGNEATKTWSFTIGEAEYNFYFGQLHSHTNISDGTGTLDDAYKWARDKGNADFFAVTDHSNWFDNDTGSENITELSQSTSEKWKLLNTKANEYNKNNEYVALGGYEMTWSGSTGGWGHINTFNTPWFASRTNKAMGLKEYYAKISQWPESINQLNHPGKTFGDFGDFGFYSEEADNVVQLIEVGNGEGPIRGSGYFPSYEYYTRALDKGWHLAPTNNQDNHKGNWITSNEARTVIVSDFLTRDSIYDGIRDMRVYATENKNLEIMYKINGQVMGSKLSSPDKLNFSITVNEPDEADIKQKIEKIDIISNGGIVAATNKFDSHNVNWNFELDPMYDYYYVRVVQVNGDISVTAPIWIGEVLAVGLGGLDVSSDYFELGSSIDLDAIVYNNGESMLSSANVEFYVGSIDAENKIGKGTVENIAKGATGKATISWTPAKAGEYNLYAVATIAGIDKQFTTSTKVTVVPKGSAVKVMVDYAHSNHYVNGDYAGMIVTFKEMLNSKNMIMIENHDTLTDEVLNGMDILVITSPQPRDKGEVKRSKLSDEEIQAVKRFTDRGGSLIITSRANYGDGIEDYQNSIQGNKVLNAIGSNIIFNSDQVIDTVNNGGQAYRLYLNTYTSEKYNLTSSLTVEDLYSFYSGCSVLLKDDGNSENVDFLVKGHSTTKNDNAGNVTTGHISLDEGNVYGLAVEQLPSGGKVVVSGTTFFSDFEMSGDNRYSNIQIASNILDWLEPEVTVDVKTIREVRDGMPANFGEKFAIEGRVTAMSEAYSKDNNLANAFFEVIYVQDETGGMTVFGVSNTKLPLGTKVRITGIAGEYEGDYQLQITNELKDLVILDDTVEEITPKFMSTEDSMKKKNEGWLVQVRGTVTRIDLTDNSLYLQDDSGVEARVYVNGYIGDGSGNEDRLGKWDPSIEVGDIVTAVGLASTDSVGPRLRVRNTAEIVKENVDKYPLVIGRIEKVEEDGLTVCVNIEKLAAQGIEGVVIIKLIDNYGRAYKVIYQKTTFESRINLINFDLNIADYPKGIKDIKVYVWDSLDNMNPLAEVK